MIGKIPKIEERRIIATQKPKGYVQYFLTLPKEYAEKMRAQGTSSLIIVYNTILIAFPTNLLSEEEMPAFLQTHLELQRLLRKQT